MWKCNFTLGGREVKPLEAGDIKKINTLNYSERLRTSMQLEKYEEFQVVGK